MVQIAGKYTFVSQDNFDEYLKAAGIEILLKSQPLKSFKSSKLNYKLILEW